MYRDSNKDGYQIPTILDRRRRRLYQENPRNPMGCLAFLLPIILLLICLILLFFR